MPTLVVVGLGYVGLPLAQLATRRGVTTVGLDTSARVTDQLNAGRSHVDDISDEYPVFLTTGRVVSQFLTGTQTRRIGPLVGQYPEPRLEIHPRLAEKLGITDGAWATCETRRGAITLRAMIVTTIRPDTVFIPYHWPGQKSVNRLTVAAQDPISKIPQYKVCGCRVSKATAQPPYAAVLEPQQ